MTTITQDRVTPEMLAQRIGEETGVSDWFELTQDRVTAFGGVTLDFDPHHIDPLQAKAGPFGVPTAQGFLTLSLLTHFVSTTPSTIDFRQNINYGFDRVRFVRPAKVGHHLRARFVLKAVDTRRPGTVLLTLESTVESREDEAAVLAADWLVLLIL